jgi:8-oxo-dGTP pyrophosphatase MutT (NUDIX family)
MAPYPFNDTLRQQVQSNLSTFDNETLDQQQLRHAAVAIVIVKHPDSPNASILLTLRPDHMNRHGGQYALPGGQLDAGEAPVEGALRELHEELGLPIDAAQVLGVLDDYPTRSGFRITPVVVWAEEPVDLKPDPNEVAQAFHIPLTELDSPDIPILSDTAPGERSVLSAYLPTLGCEVYAPTAAMLYQFREVAMRGRATRVAEYDQPEFAWK